MLSSEIRDSVTGMQTPHLFATKIFTALIDGALRDFANRWKYVDDMNIAETRLLHQPCTLQPTLDNLNTWVSDHNMALNLKTCKVLCVCFARVPPPSEPQTISVQSLEIVVCIRILRMTTQIKSKFDQQEDNIVKILGPQYSDYSTALTFSHLADALIQSDLK